MSGDTGIAVPAGGPARWRLPGMDFGTSGYREPVARRLRVLNMATLMAAFMMTGFAVVVLLLGPGDARRVGAVYAASAVFLAMIPLLNRFGPLVATLGFAFVGYGVIFAISAMIGTGAGAPMQYFVAAAILVLVLGAEYSAASAALTAVAAALILLLQVSFPADTGLLPENLALASLVTNVTGSAAILFAIVFYAVRDVARAEAATEREHARSESLLANMLPAEIAERLKRDPGGIVVDRYEQASVLFADLADFTRRAGQIPPEELVRCLNRVFGEFDLLAARHGLEKIKTSGDAYMVVSGVPRPRPDHAEALADFAIALRDLGARLPNALGEPTAMRIGIASGPVVAGVIGVKRMSYDVWGDTVNIASRMESTGPVGAIQVSPAASVLLAGKFLLDPHGPVDVKGKGAMATWLLRQRLSGNPEPTGVLPRG